MLSQHSSRSVFRIGLVSTLCLASTLYAQTPTAPTASDDPEKIDQIWQKASSKYDG
jgi:hypothetical protein